MARMREYFETGQEDQRRTHATAWIPTTDIFASGDDLVIRCELAGVRREDIDIALSGDVLTISGERRSELNEEEIHFYTRERSFGHFRRSMNLPEGIDGSDISADFRDGVLQVSVQGGATAVPEPQRIEIRDESG
jgi:HSP20 family protein